MEGVNGEYKIGEISAIVAIYIYMYIWYMTLSRSISQWRKREYMYVFSNFFFEQIIIFLNFILLQILIW